MFCCFFAETTAIVSITAAGLAQSVERLTAEREVVGSIPGVGKILRVLNKLRNDGNTFALQMARPSRGSDNNNISFICMTIIM